MNLNEFTALIGTEMNTVRTELSGNVGALAHAYFGNSLGRANLNAPTRVAMEQKLMECLRYFSKIITPQMMVSYIATELFENKETGLEVMEFLLQNAGVEFIERFPALYDNQLSYGGPQLTPYVVGPHGSTTTLLHIAHRDSLVPKSLGEFKGIEDHIRAGYVFALHNMITVLQSIVETHAHDLTALNASLNALIDTGDQGGGMLLEYLSAAHHAPVLARGAFLRWSSQNAHVPQAHRTLTLQHSFDATDSGQSARKYAEHSRDYFSQLASRGTTAA